MILSAKIPRLVDVTPAQMHWVGLHLRYGRELLAEAALDRGPAPAGSGDAEYAGRAGAHPAGGDAARTGRGEGGAGSRHAVGAATCWHAKWARAAIPRVPACWRSIRRLAGTSPKEVNYAAISRAFGTPKPTLANSYEPELLNLRTFPTLMGYSSRIMAESWESNTLYWAALADELSVSPAQLNVRIPEWTRKLVEQIFASHLEDWPAVLKSLRAVGDDVRAQGPRARAPNRRPRCNSRIFPGQPT